MAVTIYCAAIGTNKMRVIKVGRSQHFDSVLFVSVNFSLQNGHSLHFFYIHYELLHNTFYILLVILFFQ